MLLNKKQRINAGIVGTDCCLSSIGMFQMIQDAITEMMGLNKIDGVTVKQKYNAFWVFTKTRAKILKKLAWGSEISINCYISNFSAIRMYADVEIRNEKEELVMHSRTELCILDVSTQRIKKLSSVGVVESIISNHLRDEIVFTTFDDIDMQVIEEVKVKSTNIDFSHHTNNTEYIRFITNTYSVAELEAKSIKEMEVMYLNQSFENDILKIKKASLTGKDLFVIEKEGKPILKCEIVY